jgi:uncharacterized protein DUF7019
MCYPAAAPPAAANPIPVMEQGSRPAVCKSHAWAHHLPPAVHPQTEGGLRPTALTAAACTRRLATSVPGSLAWHHQMVILTREAPLRYYTYISDYKLDMLYEQISPALRRRISGELKVDLKLAGLILRGSEQPEATRMIKLRAIEHYIDKHHHVGSISDPGREFFRGSMDMQWGWLTPQERREECACGKRHSWEEAGWKDLCGGGERISPVVIFRGFQRHAQGIDFVLLGGSRKHVLGSGAELDPAASLAGGSLMSTLIRALEKGVSQLKGFTPSEEYRYVGPTARWAIQAGMCMNMKAAARQRLDFLAVPYGRAEIKMRDETLYGVIGSPIYVAHG